jgi:predicted DNA repair protein MutK
MTAGVYGLVGLIVKLDDFGAWLHRRPAAVARALGAGILRAAPWLMRALSVAGTAAMFLVGGTILAHGLPPLEHVVEAGADLLPGARHPVALVVLHAVAGMAAGLLALVVVEGSQRLWKRRAS